MNYVLETKENSFALYGVRRGLEGFTLKHKVISKDGMVINQNEYAYPFPPNASLARIEEVRQEVNKRAKEMSKTKVKMRGWKSINLEEEPKVWKVVGLFLEDDDKQWISNEKMMELINEAVRERYVFFKDISGIEDRFDLGVQYLAVEAGEPDTLDVFDRFGEICACYRSRFLSVELTEDSARVLRKK